MIVQLVVCFYILLERWNSSILGISSNYFGWYCYQVIYELKAGGVDERRLVGAKLEKLAEGDTGTEFCTK